MNVGKISGSMRNNINTSTATASIAEQWINNSVFRESSEVNTWSNKTNEECIDYILGATKRNHRFSNFADRLPHEMDELEDVVLSENADSLKDAFTLGVEAISYLGDKFDLDAESFVYNPNDNTLMSLRNHEDCNKYLNELADELFNVLNEED